MPESPLLLLSAVPACGSSFQRGREVKESRSGRPIVDRYRRARAPGRKALRARPSLGSASCRLQNRGNKARMLMKTKDRRGNRPPLLIQGGEFPGSPLQLRRGEGVVGLCILRAHFTFVYNWVSDIEKWRNKARMFMKTKDRPANQPPLIQGGESSRLAPLLGSGGVGGGATLRPLRALRLGVKPDI